MAPRVRHIEIYQSPSRYRWSPRRYLRIIQQWRYRVVGANNKKMAPSQGYTRKASAVRAARELYPDLPIEFE